MNSDKIHEQEEALSQEVDSFQDEKERIRSIIGAIGGTRKKLYTHIINIGFLISLMVLFCLEFFTDLLDKLLAVEIGVLLISVKILWMMYEQSRVEHFMFWILSSIEFQVSSIEKKIDAMNKTPKEKESKPKKQET